MHKSAAEVYEVLREECDRVDPDGSLVKTMLTQKHVTSGEEINGPFYNVALLAYKVALMDVYYAHRGNYNRLIFNHQLLRHDYGLS